MPARSDFPRLAWRAAGALSAVLLPLGAWAAEAQARPATVARPAQVASGSSLAADAGTESQFIGRINSLRASKGLSQLQVSSELVGVARSWTDHMVSDGQISHNPNLGSQVGGAWTKLGENVGVGYDVDGLMRAFINSPSHYENLVDPSWTHVGVGVTFTSDGRLWTTHNFMALPGGSTPPPTAPPATAAPAAAPPTTAAPPPPPPPPPTTTTTTAPPPPPPQPEPTEQRVTAVLDPLRSLENGETAGHDGRDLDG